MQFCCLCNHCRVLLITSRMLTTGMRLESSYSWKSLCSYWFQPEVQYGSLTHLPTVQVHHLSLALVSYFTPFQHRCKIFTVVPWIL